MMRENRITDGLKKIPIDFVMRITFQKMTLQNMRLLAGDLPLIQHLQGKHTRFSPGFGTHRHGGIHLIEVFFEYTENAVQKERYVLDGFEFHVDRIPFGFDQ